MKVALGLSYAKIRHELRSYFGLTISMGELPDMVAEVAALFGPAYARLIALMRRQAAIHIDETSWRIDGSMHWLWVFVNDVVALYVVSRSRGSKVPQALLGADFWTSCWSGWSIRRCGRTIMWPNAPCGQRW